MGERRAGSDNMKFELIITTPCRRSDATDNVMRLPFVKAKNGRDRFHLGDIEVSTIDEIMQLFEAMSKDGLSDEIVIGTGRPNEGVPYIEIYNGYREF